MPPAGINVEVGRAARATSTSIAQGGTNVDAPRARTPAPELAPSSARRMAERAGCPGEPDHRPTEPPSRRPAPQAGCGSLIAGSRAVIVAPPLATTTIAIAATPAAARV